MRRLTLIPLLLLVAGCGDSAVEENKKSARPASLAAGQWDLTSEVTSVDPQDQGRPAIEGEAGTRATHSVCVAEGRAPSELFSGDGYTCSYNNYYVRNGRANVTLDCRREGLQGAIVMTADGTFEADELSYRRNLRTILAGDGDVLVDYRVTGRRTGDCAAPAEDEANKADSQ